jgi:hypothetical protein
LQLPVPSQFEVPVNVADEHEAVPHVMSEPTKAAHFEPSLPSQVFAEHVVVPVSHLVRVPCGAPMIAVQVPNVPA